MFIYIAISIFFLSFSFFLLGFGIGHWQNAITTIISNISFSSKRKQFEEEGTENENYSPRYDVSAFTQRMNKLREEVDKDGLFHYPLPPERSDVAGTEIMTEEREIKIDNDARS